MAVVTLHRWSPGLNKVALTKLLHSQGEIPLSVAKSYVDEFLDGHEVTFTVRSLPPAKEIVRAATGIGAVASVGEHASDAHDEATGHSRPEAVDPARPY
jgi:hypothetical protein